MGWNPLNSAVIPARVRIVMVMSAAWRLNSSRAAAISSGESPSRLVFRYLGLHAGTDIGIHAVASLTAQTPARTRKLLGTLAAAHVVARHRPGRYQLHDLLKVYAPEQGTATDDEVFRTDAGAACSTTTCAVLTTPIGVGWPGARPG
jgi:hypothetical protein